MRPAWYDRITHRVWNGQQKYGTSTICPISLKAWSFLLFTGHKYWLPIFFSLLASHLLFPITGFPLFISRRLLPITYFLLLASQYLFHISERNWNLQSKPCSANWCCVLPATTTLVFVRKRKDYYNKNKSRCQVIFLKHTPATLIAYRRAPPPPISFLGAWRHLLNRPSPHLSCFLPWL